jgi:hypothetical protein
MTTLYRISLITDAGIAERPRHCFRTLLQLLRAVRTVVAEGACARVIVETRGAPGEDWHAIEDAEINRYAASYRITNWRDLR